VKKLMKHIKTNTQSVAAAKSGMTEKTARKYLKSKQLPSELLPPKPRGVRLNPFADDWDEVSALLESSPGLQAKTIFDHLNKRGKEPKYIPGQLRTLQRHMKAWFAAHGPSQKVIFSQNIQPGRQSQSDWTWMNDLKITIGGKHLKHMVYHFMLPYSCWESVMLCYNESFSTLSQGYEKAVWELGCVAPEHRTDNLSAATKKHGNTREFTLRWQTFLEHYRVTPSRNNPGESQENGSVEKSNDLFKSAVNQELLLRGSRNFTTIEAYQEFLESVVANRNAGRKERLSEEIKLLKSLPDAHFATPEQLSVRVCSGSTINIDKIPYSVPSRLIGFKLKALVYLSEICLYYGSKQVYQMPRAQRNELFVINYRHIIDSLITKPGAFEYYKYREALYPRVCFRQAFDALKQASPANGHKHYLQLLKLAKLYSEEQVALAIKLLLECQQCPHPNNVTPLIKEKPTVTPSVHINQPNLSVYDQLRQQTGELH
jgi:transposase